MLFTMRERMPAGSVELPYGGRTLVSARTIAARAKPCVSARPPIARDVEKSSRRERLVAASAIFLVLEIRSGSLGMYDPPPICASMATKAVTNTGECPADGGLVRLRHLARHAKGGRCRSLGRFSDAGLTRLSTSCGGRRPKSAKARSRGKWGTGGGAGAGSPPGRGLGGG